MTDPAAPPTDVERRFAELMAAALERIEREKQQKQPA